MQAESHDQRWRELTPDVRSDFCDQLKSDAAKRQEQGRLEYGDRFKGDPLDQLHEEIIDGAFYVWQARRRHLQLVNALNLLLDLLNVGYVSFYHLGVSDGVEYQKRLDQVIDWLNEELNGAGS